MYVRQRQGSPLLLWLHGLGEHGGCFEAIAAHPRLARFGALIPDLPGYGRTPPDGDGLEEVAAGLARWLGDRVPVVVGHSMGGVIGMMLAEQHPIAHLIDVDGNVSLGDCTFSGRAAARPADGFDLAETRTWVASLGLHDHAERLRAADAATYHRHATDLVRLSTPGDLAARLARLSVPVTYLAGYPDGACTRSRELLAAAGIARVDVAPSGHWPYVDQPDAFAAAVDQLIVS